MPPTRRGMATRVILEFVAEHKRNMLISRLVQAINLKNRKIKRKFANDVDEVRRSGRFDRQFYLNMYKDVRADKFWAANPELHYLLFGAAEYRKPAKDFDTQWYLVNNEDVAESDLNPLVHFIRFGAREGRRPNGDRYSHTTRDKREHLKNTVVNHLWGGYAKPALTDLAAIYNAEDEQVDVRFFAAWHAARWYFYIGDYQKTFELAQLVTSLDDHYAQDKAASMMYAHSCFQLAKPDMTKRVSETFLERFPDDSDMLLTLANTLDNDELRLEVINRIYAPRELASIKKRQKNNPLSFDNITADTKPVVSDKKVSVIMPIFNAEDKIESAIRSLLEQSWQNLEIIAVDDNSTDSTFDILQKIAKAEPRVRAFLQEKNGGAYLARNRGVKEATGDFITTHDADDWSHPDKIAIQVDLLVRKDTVMGVCTHWTRALNNLEFTHNWNLNAKLLHWNHSSFLFRKEVIETLGAWDTVIVGGDTEFIWRVQSHYGPGSVVKYKPNIPFSFALDDEGSLTRTKSTHVNTIHNGLRHIYRGAAKWWHEHGNDVSVEPGVRKFPAPKGMLKRGDNKLDCSVVIAADYSRCKDCSNVLAEIRELVSTGQNVGIMHWPEYKSERAELHNEFFQLLMKDNVDVVVFGMDVNCKHLIIDTSLKLEPLIERLPVIHFEQLTFLNNDALTTDLEERLRSALKA